MSKSKDLKIWFLLPEMKLGGSERHVIYLASGLRQRGYDAGIACVFREGVLADEVRKKGIPLISLNAKGGYGLGTLLRIFSWIRSTPMDILHTYLFGFHLFAGLPARVLKVPAVISSRREIAYWRKRRHLWAENLGNHFVDRVVCCSQAAERWTLEREKISREKVLTIYNGVDLNRFREVSDSQKIRREFGIPEKAPLVGTVANFSAEKGYSYLLAAVKEILERMPSAWFLFVGFGPLETEIREQAKKFSHHQQIVFAGRRQDIPELLSTMDVFVLASLTEGFPNVLLEAKAMARAIVATQVGGIPELIEPPNTGILVPSKDERALARAVLSLLKDPEKAKAMGCEGRERIVKDFSMERMIDDYEALYLSFSKLGKEEKLCAELLG